MIRRSPAENYIKYLMLLPEHLSDEDIIRTLREHHLDYPGGGYLPRVRATLHPPDPFYPMNETHLASYKFLQKHKLHKMFFRDDHMRCALTILNVPQAKEMIEALIIVKEHPYTMCVRLRTVGVEATPKGIEYYGHFFWNVSLVDTLELRALIPIRVEDIKLAGEDKENMIRYQAMKRALEKDARYMAANSTSPILASARLQMRHGFMPNKVQYARLAENARMAAMLAVNEAASSQSPKAAMEARDFSMVVTAMDAVMKEQGSEGIDLRNEMSKVALSTDQSTVPTIQQLTDGYYTESVNAVEEASDDEHREIRSSR